MIVNYLNDFDCGYLFRVYRTVLLPQNRLVVRFENQLVRMNKIDSVLPLSITSQLVPPLRGVVGTNASEPAAFRTARRLIIVLAMRFPYCF